MRPQLAYSTRVLAHALGAGVLLLSVSTPSRAVDTRWGSWERPYEDAPPPPPPVRKKRDQRSLGALLNLGVWQGTGFGLQLGASRAGLRISGGWQPVFVSYYPPKEIQSRSTVYSSWLLSTDAYLNMFEATDRGRAGPLFGYRFDTVLGHGVALGGWGGLRLDRWADVFFQGGVMAFPKGAQRVRDHGNLAPGSTFDLLSPSVVIGLGVTLALFPPT